MNVDAGEVQAVEAKGKARSRRAATAGLRRFRIGVQIAVAAFVVLISVGQSLAWSWSANLHTICPFGGVANIYTYFSTGGYVAKLHSAVFVMLLALVVGLVLTGKSFCGWICPLGTVQELLGKAGRRLWPRLYNKVPRKVERVLQYGKYVMLIWIIVQTARSARLFFESFDPYYNLFTIWSDEIAWIGYAVVAGVLLASLFIERPFSRYACPLGALNGLFNSFSLVQIKRDAASCTDCGRCDKACPVKIKVSQVTAVRDVECTRCLECVGACPVNAKTDKTLKLRTIFPWTKAGRKPLPRAAFAAVAVLAFALPIGVTMGTGDFIVTTTHTYTSAADIKGSSPLSDIVENFAISEIALYNGLGIPSSVGDATLIKDLASEMGLPEGEESISPATLRTVITHLDSSLAVFVAEGGADQGTISKAAAAAGLTDASTVRELMEKGPSGSVLAALTAVSSLPEETTQTTVDTSAPTAGPTTPTTQTTATSATTIPATATSAATESDIKGSTTLDQVKSMVSDYPAFLAEFGIDPAEEGGAVLKDLKTKYGFELDAVRSYVESH